MIIFDEPAVGVDAVSQSKVHTRIRSLVDFGKYTVLVVTREPKFFQDLGNMNPRILGVKDKKLAQDASFEEAVKDERGVFYELFKEPVRN